MKRRRPLLVLAILVVVITIPMIYPQPRALTWDVHAKEINSKRKIIADTLAAHKVTCLSRNGSIKTVLLDGKWIDVREVELLNRTLIIRTDVGTLSLAAVVNSP